MSGGTVGRVRDRGLLGPRTTTLLGPEFKLVARDARAELVTIGEDDCDGANLGRYTHAGEGVSDEISGVPVTYRVAADTPCQ